MRISLSRGCTWVGRAGASPAGVSLIYVILFKKPLGGECGREYPDQGGDELKHIWAFMGCSYASLR